MDEVPTGNNWLHEIKYDGYRCLLAVAGEEARIYTRSGKDWTGKFGEIATAATSLITGSALIDGEIVALDEKGNPDFSRLQQALKDGADGLILFAFDLLERNGEDLTQLTNIERKERLSAVLAQGNDRIRFSDHLIGAGEKLLDAMCKAGQEGIISKRADAPYRGRRTRDWRKIKCTRRQEFVILGWRTSVCIAVACPAREGPAGLQGARRNRLYGRRHGRAGHQDEAIGAQDPVGCGSEGGEPGCELDHAETGR